MTRMTSILRNLLVALMGAVAFANPGAAQPVSSLADGRVGRIEFHSVTPATTRQLVRRENPPPAVVRGTLQLPANAAGKVPAMVIAHGSSGITDARELAWASRFNEIGVASFVVDSFGPRNIQSTGYDQSQLSVMANVADALSALRLLATHPRIDPRRIGVIGFSRGGSVAQYTALEPIRKGVIDGDLKFAVHVPAYPPCNTVYVASATTRAPMLFLLGELDDYTPIKPCGPYIEWLRSKGAEASAIVYSGAYHGFDGGGNARFISGLQTGRGCNAEFNVETLILKRLDTGAVIAPGEPTRAYYAECGSRGATAGGNNSARAKAQSDVQAYLKRVFGL